MLGGKVMDTALFELQVDIIELQLLGLDVEEIDGYLCLFIDTYDLKPLEAWEWINVTLN